MTWLAVKVFLKKGWIWLRENWQIPFLFAWTILVYVLTRRNTDSLIEVIEAKKDSYKKQVEILKRTHNDELLKRQKLQEKYEIALTELEKDFDLKKEELSEKSKNLIKEAVVRTSGDIEKVKKRIEEEFGLIYVK